MSRIILNIDDGIAEEDAIMRLATVIQGGRISTTSKYNIPHYCWITTWKDGIAISTHQKRNKDSADSFRCFKMLTKDNE